MPETALVFATIATESQTDWTYVLTLGHAYLANEQYEKALQAFKRSLDLLNQSVEPLLYIEDLLLSRISEMSRRAADKKPYLEIADQLLDALPEKLIRQFRKPSGVSRILLRTRFNGRRQPSILQNRFHC